jgi:hypothetical protein
VVGGDCTRDSRDKSEQNGSHEQNDRIARVSFGPSRENRVQRNGKRDSDGDSSAHAHQRRRKHNLKYMPTRRTQRHANAKLVGSLRHRVRDHAVKPDGGQNERETGEDAEDPGGEMLLLPLRLFSKPGTQVFRAGKAC